MHVQPIASTMRKRGRKTARAHVAVAVAPKSWSPLTAPMPEIGRMSRADGEFPVDEARARADAAKTLAQIDFSKRDLMLWVPGTDGHEVDSTFARARAYAAQPSDSVSLSAVDYMSTWDLRTSCPTGIATLKLVLAGIKARLGADMANHRVMLGGLSQGAWIIGEVMADRRYSDIVQRAVLMGHPWLAAHQYNSGQDPRVRVVNHFDDQVTLPVAGSAADGLDTMAAIHTGHLSSHLPEAIRAIAHNPHHGWLLARGYTYEWPIFKGIWQDAHNYLEDMLRGYVYLATGAFVPSDRQVYGSLDH
ncbi:MAG: hypothetical protein JWN41_1331 [Thermoleophilia bacterium]|nr:hypothetical protein [Thermoleophilia bacterium]